ncbi:MAG: hypothetical protein IPI53_10305 [Saprospiraceae bacterium]|nr:hypothetical protein [Saprospiraceae bacterium]
MIKYENGVGAEYKITNNKGQSVQKNNLEKTGIDDYNFGFLLIKTTKVEHPLPLTIPGLFQSFIQSQSINSHSDVEFVQR